MPVASAVSRLPHLPPPVLTAYLDTNPANPRNQSTPRGYVTWLKSAGRALGRDLHPEARKQLRRQLRRVNEYLRSWASRGRALVLFAGPEVWETIRLQAPVHDEIHWGKPSLQQMAWVLDEHRLRGAVLIDGSGARFFRFWLGKVTEDESVAFSLDTTHWRKPHLVGPSTPGVSKQSGTQRDRASVRMQAQYKRFADDLAKRIARWSDNDQISPVVLVGDRRQIEGVLAAMPQRFRAHIELFPKALSRTSVGDVRRELEPVLHDWERDYEKRKVEELISVRDPARAVLGVDETLRELQAGRVRELVIARGIKGNVRQCVNCGWLDRTAAPACPLCGSERRSRALRTVIPELGGNLGLPMEIVAGDAAAKLRKHGGMGGWLGARKKPIRRVAVATAASPARRRK